MHQRIRILSLILTCAIFCTGQLTAQNFVNRYFNKMLNDTTDNSQPQLIVYPTVAFAPETSWEFGLSALYVYHANRDTTNRLSEVNAFTFFTLEEQYGLWLDHAIYSDKNKWFFLGKLRFQSFPLFYHGIGPTSPEDFLARVEANQILIKERVLRHVKNDFYLGLEFDYQRLTGTEFVLGENVEPFDLPVGNQGSTNVGLGIGLVKDNRHNVLNVRKGFFSELALIHYNAAWGSTYNFTSIISDSRIYRPVGNNNVFAAQVLGQFNVGDVPFNQLALLGGESIMRGYYYGRYRDKNQLATQAEYRFLPLPLNFTNRLGFAVFAGAGTVFDNIQSTSFSNLVFSAGAGIRFLVFPKKDIWTRLDFALTNEGSGFYLFIGEAF